MYTVNLCKCPYCGSYHYEVGYFTSAANCIVTEAERYINSVWHDMKEKPDFKKLPVLLKHKSGGNSFY